MKHIKHVKHGESKTRLYRIWSNLKNRVLPNSVKAKYYFDRGIGLCDEWKNSFTSFRDWSINNGYDDKLTIDRIDNNLGYSPENCRWVDMKTQANNRSNNITVYADKECVPFSDVCKILGVDYNTAYGKIIRNLVANKNVQRTVKNCKEPVNDELEKAAVEAFKQIVDSDKNNFLEIFKAGAKWQKEKEYTCYEEAFEDGAKWKVENLWKPADGDDLPEYEREVVAFQEKFPTDVDVPSLFKIVIAHRPNPDGWDGKSLSTGKVEHYTPKTYDKGGWNIPDVKFWLDCKIPKEIEL